MRRARHFFVQSPIDLGQFFHKVGLGLQATGRIHKHQVRAFLCGPVHGLKSHRRRIVAGRFGVKAHAHPAGPGFKLLNGRGPKSIRRGEKHFAALQFGPISQFGNGRGFARAVNSDHQHHFRTLHRFQAAVGLNDGADLGNKQGLNIQTRGRAAFARFIFQAVEQDACRFHAHIGGD